MPQLTDFVHVCEYVLAYYYTRIFHCNWPNECSFHRIHRYHKGNWKDRPTKLKVKLRRFKDVGFGIEYYRQLFFAMLCIKSIMFRKSESFVGLLQGMLILAIKKGHKFFLSTNNGKLNILFQNGEKYLSKITKLFENALWNTEAMYCFLKIHIY